MLIRRIHVAEHDRCYDGCVWRDAILYFVRNINVPGSKVWLWSKLVFECDDGKRLTLRTHNDQYWAYGDVPYVEHEMQMPVVDACERVFVERALMRLEETGMPVTILLRADAYGVSTVTLWTHREGNELHVSAYHLPTERDVFHVFAGGKPFSEVH